jgi:hypothetical protein
MQYTKEIIGPLNQRAARAKRLCMDVIKILAAHRTNRA